jgi:hypothetical protein
MRPGTIPHRIALDVPQLANTPHAWDVLRTTPGAFASPATPEQLEHAARSRPELRARADAINRALDAISARSAVSYGAGGGQLEWWLLNQRPQRPLTVTEFAPASLDRLRASLPAAQIEQHDMLAGDPLTADAHIFHRIDTEFTDDQWRSIYTRFQQEDVILAVSELLTVDRILGQQHQQPGLTEAGWLRTRRATERLWRHSHIASPMRIGDLHGWHLRPR